MNTGWKRRRFYFIPFAILAVFVFGAIVMLLWNNVVTPVLHVSVVNFWQALGLLVLSKLLFSSFSGGRGSYRRDYYAKQKMMWNQMTPEQKENFRKEWKDRCSRTGYKGENDFLQTNPGTEAV
ncbi:MAG: hypothetical protein ACM3VS_14175 [Candidatus Dadabacteria bacterium]